MSNEGLNQQSLKPKLELTLHSFSDFGWLGEGSYAEVYEALDLRTNEKVVLKKLSKQQVQSQLKRKEVYMERFMLIKYSKRHPGIISFHGMFQDEDYIYFVLEDCPYGDLGKLTEKISFDKAPETDFLIRCYIYQLCHIVSFLHGEGIAHLDIKPQNIVIDNKKNLKLIDFSTCYYFDKSKKPQKLAEKLELAEKEKEKRILEDEFRSSMGSFVGTPEYVSPEMLDKSTAGKEADLWAIGCIIYEFYNGSPPFTGVSQNAIFNNIISLNYKLMDSQECFTIPDDAKDIIQKLLKLNPSERLGAKSGEDLLNHSYFDDVRNLPHWKDELWVPECQNIFKRIQARPIYESIYQTEQQYQELSPVDPSNPQSKTDSPNPKLDIVCFSASIDNTKTKCSGKEEYNAQSLPNELINVRTGFWCIPKTHILLADMKSKRLFLNDFKHQRVLLVNKATEIRQDGSTYTIDSLGPGNKQLIFKSLEGKFDWTLLINSMKCL